MQTDLIQTRTNDGIALDGAYFTPIKHSLADALIDGVLLIHGSAGSFYSNMNRALAERVTKAGFPCVAFNTRGHDVVWGVPGHLFGTAYEILDGCRIDIKAMFDWMGSNGMKRIAVFGHSIGAVKAVYYKAVEQDPRVTAIVCCSPVRLSHNYFLRTEAADEHLSNLKIANDFIERGRPDALFEVKFPSPHIVGASAYVDKYGPEEKYNLTRYIAGITCPILITVGTRENSTHHRHCAEDVYMTIRERPYARMKFIEDADHIYTGKLDDLARSVGEYLASLKPGHIWA